MRSFLTWRFWLACLLVSLAWHLARAVERNVGDDWWAESIAYLVFFLMVRSAGDLFAWIEKR